MRAPLFLAPFLALASAEDRVDDLLDWFRERGGYLSPKLELRRADPTDPTSRYGIFATARLAPKEHLLALPRGDGGVVLESEDGGELACATVRRLAWEAAEEEESWYAPYLAFLAGEARGALPSAWSAGGRELLTGILRNHTQGQFLPPEEVDEYIDPDWYEECGGSASPHEAAAAAWVVSRGADGVMMPVYDMMRHRNAPYANTEDANVRHASKPIRVRTTKTVQAGEELFQSLNMCKGCVNRWETFGTPELFRNYGFVEELPQRWLFPYQDFGFEVGEDLEVSWIWDPPGFKGVVFLRDVAEIMREAVEQHLVDFTNYDHYIPPAEFAAIKEFCEAYLQAVSLALEQAVVEGDEAACPPSDAEENTCAISPERYAGLQVDTEEIDLEEHAICDNLDVLRFQDYDFIEEKQSKYQLITTFHNEEADDTCFLLDETVQICTNYRPHYHEMVVHYTARHLPQIRRVVWVGGGDSMLLHDILKYPALEKVIGLELDQDVTRNAFKHFGVQPHWDDPRVEWWYGDAAKSLLMLPQDYFGSFDLVLV
eukprot:CAMPEP_0194327108 /NCGR_PEP_ID=MMETSP0171-20130528/39668_1 /TAXON_ID=218684 /ORGANISM="Corethron pennatum, Strain L29A3" /LENGTH=542 /DNA_ID=CAMNT_0039086945 /DNA_START=32 /DNA_END=1657 /DNA_ORIENTATION=+